MRPEPTETQSVFYIYTTGGGRPKRPHQDIESARTEARRLADVSGRRAWIFSVCEFHDPVNPPPDDPYKRPPEIKPEAKNVAPSGRPILKIKVKK